MSAPGECLCSSSLVALSTGGRLEGHDVDEFLRPNLRAIAQTRCFLRVSFAPCLPVAQYLFINNARNLDIEELLDLPT
jgi:hypothetical protein